MAVLPYLVPHGSGLVAALVDSALLSLICSLLLWPIAGKHLHSIAVGKKGIADIVLAKAIDGILTANERGVITAFNPAAERVFGYRAAEVIGRNVSMLIPEPHRSAHDRYLEDYLRGKRPGAVGGIRRVLGQRRDGSLFPLEISLGETRIGQHRIFTALMRDVSEQEKRYAERLHAQKLEAVGQLAAGIAHEINTPIQYIGDNTRFLQDAFEALGRVVKKYGDALEVAFSGPVPSRVADAKALAREADVGYLLEEIPKALEQSLEGIARVGKIVQAMKEFSHPGSEEKAPTDINRAVSTAITVCRNEWKYVAEITTNLDPELPLVPCVSGEINQVLLNLIVNAAHAIGDVVGKQPTEKGRITIATRRVGNEAEITVKDTGSGIPEAARSMVFDPFFTTKEVGKGTGQGLAIARSVVVEKHGGRIWFETETGKGTTFVVRLPLASDRAAEREEAAA